MIRVATILSLLLAAAASHVALAAPAPVEPEAVAFPLGALQLAALRDADNVVANDGKTFGVGIDPTGTAGVLAAAGAPTDKITLSVDALLVRAPGRVMLFDTGLGHKVHGVLMESLAKAGVTPDQVTDVFITHTHGDHVGGLMAADGGLAFPNAVIHMSADEWAFMRTKQAGSALVALIAPKVRPFAPGAKLAPGITAVALPGHTPGHSGYEIRSMGQRLLDMGDLAHSSIISLAKPEWVIQYDTDANAGRAERIAELKRLADSHERVFAPHFPFPGVGRIEAVDGGYRWRPDLPAPPP
jgi:glyoxylase-like metal-dependent hydrolase (beta-lactamase superfamily II)